MNASDWKKATAFISEHNRPAATAPTKELDSMPLSTLFLDESGPPEVTYDAHTPLTTSTPNSTTLHQQDSSLSDNYQPIFAGIPQGSLYTTLAVISTEQVATVPIVICTLHNRVITNLDKCM